MNPHTLRHQDLNLTCLPIPPLAQARHCSSRRPGWRSVTGNRLIEATEGQEEVVFQPLGDVTGADIFGDRVELVLVEEALGQGAVDLLADTTVLPVDNIVNRDIARQDDLKQIAQFLVFVGSGGAGVGFALPLTAGGVTESDDLLAG